METFAAQTACTHCGAPFTAAVAGQSICDRCQGLAHPDPKSPLQQAEVAGFRLVHELGAGRHAHSWLAEDGKGRPVVVKLLRRYAADADAVKRFLDEAERLAALRELQHPNVARPLTAGVHLASAFFLVYESGGEATLADELRQRGRVSPARALELCAQVCEGLSATHRAGVLHLDLKPANVGLTSASDGEQAVVLDAATGHLFEKAGLEDGAPLPLSSAAYTSPERAAGKPADPRSDLYSVGVLLFQLVSGRLPMMGATSDELLRAHREHPPLRLRDVGRKVSDDLENLIARLLAKEPAQRPASADEAGVLMRAIKPVADTAPMEAMPESIEDPLPVVEAPRPEPEVAPPPPLDPDLERAMLGEVPDQPPERIPGIPKWAPFVAPRWAPLAAGITLVAAITIVATLLARRPPHEANPIAVKPPVPVAKPPPVAIATVVPQKEDEPEPEKQKEPGKEPEKAPAKPSPYAKQFDRAQKAIWIGQSGAAEEVLHDLLRKRLPRRDRAVGSSRVDLQACKLEYSIVSPK